MIYKRKIGVNFRNNDGSALQKALNDIKNKRKPAKQAAECCKILKSSLYDKIRGKSSKIHGG